MSGFKLYMLSVMNDKRKTACGRIAAVFLSLCSFAYLIGLRCVYFLRGAGLLRPAEVSAKVISVGNITLGGTGKTPFVIMLAEKARAMGRKVAVLTRGYGNDELYLLKARLDGIEVIADPDRARSARRAIREFGSDCIILDDGFQHRRLKRDLDIILIDAVSPFGNMKLFPRGVLREPLYRLKDAGIVVLNKSDMRPAGLEDIYARLKALKSDIAVSESFYKASGFKNVLSGGSEQVSYVKNKRAALVAGIANPEYFEWMVKNLGADVAERFYYADHHRYGGEDIEHILKKCASGGINLIITTEKDAMRSASGGLGALAGLFKSSPSLPNAAGARQETMSILAMSIDIAISKNEEAIVAGLRSLFNSQVF